MNLETIKKQSVNLMIYSLIGTAVIAIVAVLAGDWNDTFSRAIFSLLIVVVHSLAILGFLQTSNVGNAQELKFFSNTVFFLLILSFFTAIFGIWEALPGETVGRLYGTYFVFAFASLHGQVLHQATGKEKRIDNIVYANYLFMVLVILMLLPLIWYSNLDFGDFYYRILTAVAIVDATLTFLAVILHKLYLHKHPKTSSQLFTGQIIQTTNSDGQSVKKEFVGQPMQQKRHMHPLLVVLIVLLALQFIVPLVAFLFFGLLALG